MDEVEEQLKVIKKPPRKRKSEKEPKEKEPKGGDKPKKRRGRPPLEKHPPNPPKLTKIMKKLLSVVLKYKDRYCKFDLVQILCNPPLKLYWKDLTNQDSHFTKIRKKNSLV